MGKLCNQSKNYSKLSEIYLNLLEMEWNLLKVTHIYVIEQLWVKNSLHFK